MFQIITFFLMVIVPTTLYFTGEKDSALVTGIFFGILWVLTLFMGGKKQSGSSQSASTSRQDFKAPWEEKPTLKNRV